MKPVILNLLLGIALVTAVILGTRGVRLWYLIASAHPEETVYFRAPVLGFMRSLFVALWPFALYLVVLIADREIASSRFGKAAFVVLLIYGGVLICQWIHLSRIVSLFNRNA